VPKPSLHLERVVTHEIAKGPVRLSQFEEVEEEKNIVHSNDESSINEDHLLDN